MTGDQHQLPPFQERQTRESVQAWDEVLSRARREAAVEATLRERFDRTFDEMFARYSEQGPLTEDSRLAIGWTSSSEWRRRSRA
jgi:hypothetical protein